MCNTQTAYAVQHGYTAQIEMLVVANSGLGAVDAYADAMGFPPYSALMVEQPDEWGWGDGVYVERNGLVGATFTNYALTAVPLFGPLEAVCDKAGWAVRARSVPRVGWVYLVDGYDTRADAWEAVYALLRPETHVPGLPACVDCSQPLDVDDLRSSDPTRCDSCEMQASYDRVSAEAPARVYDVESSDRPVAIGDYVRTDEDVVVYIRHDGNVACAPGDCVEVRRVNGSDEVTLRLTRDDAEAIADALDFLAGVDEGENTDYDALRRLERQVRSAL